LSEVLNVGSANELYAGSVDCAYSASPRVLTLSISRWSDRWSMIHPVGRIGHTTTYMMAKRSSFGDEMSAKPQTAS